MNRYDKSYWGGKNVLKQEMFYIQLSYLQKLLNYTCKASDFMTYKLYLIKVVFKNQSIFSYQNRIQLEIISKMSRKTQISK